MPEFRAPGVYVEEQSYRSKSIEGVPTTTAGFVGPTRFGPLDLLPEVLTSLADFERIHGDGQHLHFTGEAASTNYLWHAARAFFANGGKRLHVARMVGEDATFAAGLVAAGRSTNTAVAATDPLTHQVKPGRRVGSRTEVKARFPGAAGNGTLRFTPRVGVSLGRTMAEVMTAGSGQPAPVSGEILAVTRAGHERVEWLRATVAGTALTLTRLDGSSPVGFDAAVRGVARAVSLRVEWVRPDGDGEEQVVAAWEDLAPTAAAVTTRFAATPDSAELARTLPVVVTQISPDVLYGGSVVLAGGSDGTRPRGVDYTGKVDGRGQRMGLMLFEDLADISIVAAPALAASQLDEDVAAGVLALQAHVEQMRYRFAVIDPRENQSIGEVRRFRARFDSTRMAIYYPWVRVRDPITNGEINLPPSGFVAGIYARNDLERAVYKAPANEVVNLALGFERAIDRAQQEVLNPEGINCLRFFEGRGMRVWGARTMSSDPEWQYVNVRRYLAYLERSIDRGTQWAVFEPNGENLWHNVRRTVETFLSNEFMSGALLGDKPEKAFFVRCDRSTMTQNDVDTGRLVCVVGVAPLKPAEFLVFRIGQWTADTRN